MSTPIEHESKQIRCLVQWYSQEGHHVGHGHKPQGRKYMGKNIYWILWLKEKACWQVETLYWQTRRSCRKMMFFFLKLITINSTDGVPIIIDLSSHSYTVYTMPSTMQQICKNKWDIVCNQCKTFYEFFQWVIGYQLSWVKL